MRFQYKHPLFYDFFIRLIYPPHLTERISELVGRNKTIFEPAAGYGRMAQFLHASNKYSGIDLNPIFINFARNTHINVHKGNIFEEKNYPQSDITLLVDVVHHLSPPKLQQLFENIFSHTKEKVIVVEPAFVNMTSRYGLLGKLLDLFLRWLDNDGFNKINRWFTDEEYEQLFASRFQSSKGFDFNFQHETIANHHIVTFSRTT